MSKKIYTFRDCKYNTSNSLQFIGYCSLYMNEDKTSGRLVECKKCPCEDFILGGDDDE